MSDKLREPWRLLKERFAFNTHTGEFFLLNPAGAQAFKLALHGSSVESVANALKSESRAPPDAAQRDAEQFLARLRTLGVLDDRSKDKASDEVGRGKKKLS